MLLELLSSIPKYKILVVVSLWWSSLPGAVKPSRFIHCMQVRQLLIFFWVILKIMVRFKSVLVLKEVYKEATLTSQLCDCVPNRKMVQLILANKLPWCCWLTVGWNRDCEDLFYSLFTVLLFHGCCPISLFSWWILINIGFVPLSQLLSAVKVTWRKVSLCV